MTLRPSILWFLYLLMAGLQFGGAVYAKVDRPSVQHDLAVQIDAAAGTLRAEDRITLPPDTEPVFTLNAALTPAAQYPLESLGPVHDDGRLRAYRVQLPKGMRTFSLAFSGQLGGAVGDDLVLTADNVVLGPGAGWYPDFDGAAVRFDLQLSLPKGWLGVSQGELQQKSSNGTERWHADTPQQGIHLVAARFIRYERNSEWGRAQVYLRSADAALARQYLDATIQFLRLYSRLIGPYAYPKFALVENAQQTGYGMPSFTLLGSRVIRLPFIVHTSYPHEVLHNWWGNGVWVDYQRGNWAEALTTYLADYLLAERSGRGTEQRRAALQKYADFVADHNDFPLRTFRARHGEASQAIGYSKGMLFFHMLRRQLGDTVFVDGLRRFYRDFLFRQAGFSDLRDALEQVSGKNLRADFEQWLDRPGAPKLALGDVQIDEQNEMFRVQFQLRQQQPGPAYRLEVPVALQVAGRDRASIATVVMTAKQQSFDLLVSERPVRIAVDPAFDLMRRLDPAELPPSLGQLLGARQAVYVLPGDASPAMLDAYRTMAREWARAGDRILMDNQLAALPAGATWLLGRENRLAESFRSLAENLPVRLQGDAVELDGQRWTWDQHSVVLVAVDRGAGRQAGWIAATSPGAVAAMARKVPHYSRYGFLVFEAPTSRNVSKGEWPDRGSPLQRLLLPGPAPALELTPAAPLTAILGPP